MVNRDTNAARVREIARVAGRHGFGHLTGSARRHLAWSRGRAPELDGSRGRRLRLMLDELGPTFVKFGQLLSTRPDVIPGDILDELRQLQDHVRPIPFADVQAVLARELDRPPEEVFADIDEAPLAAASIGQVHAARLVDGREVVVKVQRPDASRQLSADIALMYRVARIAKERLARVAFVDVVALVDEFARTVRQELDYRVEARNAQAVGRHFADDPTVTVPTVDWSLTTGRVLTMTRVEGIPIAHFPLDEYDADERRQLAHRVAETWMKMVFDHGFFHADPHPANILVQDPDHLALVDFGMVGQLMSGDRTAAMRLFVDVIEQRPEKLPRRLRDLGVRYPREREAEFRDELSAIVARYHGARLNEIDGRHLLREVFTTIHRLGITLPARWVMLDKTIATLAGVGLEISPDFNVFQTARPYARRLIAQRLRPGAVAGSLRTNAERYLETLFEYPLQIADVLEELRDGEFRITVDQADAREDARRVEATANRSALALGGGALLVASSILGAFAHAGPEPLGVALVALPGLMLGLALLLWSLAGVARSGRW